MKVKIKFDVGFDREESQLPDNFYRTFCSQWKRFNFEIVKLQVIRVHACEKSSENQIHDFQNQINSVQAKNVWKDDFEL